MNFKDTQAGNAEEQVGDLSNDDVANKQDEGDNLSSDENPDQNANSDEDQNELSDENTDESNLNDEDANKDASVARTEGLFSCSKCSLVRYASNLWNRKPRFSRIFKISLGLLRISRPMF